MQIRTLFFLLILLSNELLSQNVGIGTNNPNSSAKLDISSTDKGVLLPRTDTSLILNPVAGLIIFQQSSNQYYFYDGNKWTPFSDKNGLWDNMSGITHTDSDVAIGGSTKVGAGNLTVHSDATGYGGIYSNVNNTSGRPFFGYGINGTPKAFHYFDNSTQSWILNKSGTALHLNNNNNFSIGTTFGLQKLHVNGAIQLGNTLQGYSGSIKWDGSDFLGYFGDKWKSLSKVDSSVWEYYDSPSYENDFVYRAGNILLGDFESFPGSSTPLGFSDQSKLTIASNNGIGSFWTYINGLNGKLESFWSVESGLSAKRLAIGVSSTSGADAHLSLFVNSNLGIQLNNNYHKYSAKKITFSESFSGSSDKGINFVFEDTNQMSSRILFKGYQNLEDYGFSFDYNETGETNPRNVPQAMFGFTAHNDDDNGKVVYLIDRASGYMGIGETPPSRHFHINSNAGVDPFRVSTNSIVALEVEANGDVGIGTADPSDLLHISSSGTKDPFRVQMDGTTRLRVHDNGSVSIGSNTKGPIGGLYCDGVAEKPGGGLWSIPSDIRLKEDIEDYDSGIEELLNVRTVSFKYNASANSSQNKQTHVGVIAQELEKIKPEMVSMGEDGFLRVDPNEFLYMLINATKEQEERIEILELEIKKLKTELKLSASK